jgi:serine/threonine-protein kinase RsbW
MSPSDGNPPTRLRFDIPSDFAHGRDVQQRIMDAVERHRFTENAAFAIKLALDEAMINAIKHGNKLDPSKRVKIEVEVSDTEADIVIHDQGEGFLREHVPDPTLEENLEKAGGRGILLIEAYMTRAEWSDHGRRLHMIRRNDDSTVTPPHASS